MIREMSPNDRKDIDEMQFELQKYFSTIDQTHESLSYKTLEDAHLYMSKMMDDVDKMNGKIFVAEEDNQVVGFIQGVIIEHEKGDDEIYDLTHSPSKEGWIGLLFVKPQYRSNGIGQNLLTEMKNYFKSQNCTSIKLLVLSDNAHAIDIYEKNGFHQHNIEMVSKI